jgi:hypothetical protein
MPRQFRRLSKNTAGSPRSAEDWRSFFEERAAVAEFDGGLSRAEADALSGITVAHFLTVADVDRSLRFYEKVFGGRILSRGEARSISPLARRRLRSASAA